MADVKSQPTEGSNEIVERVAITIFVSWYDGSPMAPVAFYTDCDDVLQADYRRIARAAIAALREPTDAMLCGHGVHPSCHTCGGGYEQWQAMIDTALIGGPPHTEDQSEEQATTKRLP